ncbi:MAG: hypothetical protein AB8H12_17770 [Lewinella sp.]
MTRRDYFIIFCLLLPFFITLPWLIVSRQALGQQKELVELTRDTLHINNLRCARLKLSTEPYIERNKALEENNEILIQKLTEKGVKVVTQELPPNPKFFTEHDNAQQKKIEELTLMNEQLRVQLEALQQGEAPATPAVDKSVPAPQLPPVSEPLTTASQKEVSPPNRNKEPDELVAAKSIPHQPTHQPKEVSKPEVKDVPSSAPMLASYESMKEPSVVKNTASTAPMSTTYERMEMSEPAVKNVTSTERVSASNQNNEGLQPVKADIVSTEPGLALDQKKESAPIAAVDKSLSAPVVSSAPPTQPVKKTAPLYNLAPKGIRIISIGERMQEQITRAGIEGLAGENFRIKLFIKEASGTSSSKMQRIVVEFDLKNVPESYHGARDLFLVLTNRGGEVVITPQSTTANVPFNGSTVSLKTTAKSRADFVNTQHLSIEQNLSSKLAKGRYRAQIYCDLAVLGMIDFEVL